MDLCSYFVFSTGQGTPAEPLITPDNRAAQKINPIGTFRAMSQCTGATDCDKVTFEWYLGCIIPDLTEPVDYSDISNYENVTLSPDPELQPVERLRVDNRLRKFCIFCNCVLFPLPCFEGGGGLFAVIN